MNYTFSYSHRYSDKVLLSTNYTWGITQEGAESQWGVGFQVSISYDRLYTHIQPSD